MHVLIQFHISWSMYYLPTSCKLQLAPALLILTLITLAHESCYAHMNFDLLSSMYCHCIYMLQILGLTCTIRVSHHLTVDFVLTYLVHVSGICGCWSI